MSKKFESLLIFLLIASASIFDCENFIFIRIFSLTTASILIFYLFKRKLNQSNLFLDIFLFLFIVSFALNYSFSVNKYNVRIYFAEYAGYFALMYLVNNFKEKRDIMAILPYGLIASSLIQILYSIPQIIRGDARIDGNGGYANFMGFHLLLGILSTVHLLKKAINEKKSILVILIGILLMLLSYMALRTGSRNIIILAPIIVIFSLWGLRKKYVFIILTAIILLIVLIPNGSIERLLNEGKNNPYGTQRINIYKQVIDISLNHPFIGIGRNNLPLYSLETNFPVEGGVSRYGVHAEIAHSEYLEWIVGQGMFGLAMLLMMLIMFIIFERNKKYSGENKKYLLFLILLYVFYGFIDNALYLPYNAVAFFILIALIMPYSDVKAKQIKIEKYIIPVFLLIMLIFISLDIFVYFYSKKLVNEPKKLTGETENDLSIYNEMLKTAYICAVMSNNPRYFKYSFQINEKIFEKSGFVSDFYCALNALELYQKYDRRNHNTYLEAARFLIKYNETVLRKNENVDSMVLGLYEKAIKLNPFNPFLREEYAEYLISIFDTNYACMQMESAIANENNFIRGYLFLYVYKKDGNKKELAANIEKIEKIKKNSGKLRDYDKILISK
ncbi:MAG: hypothetical protein COX48_03155 [bacterium (Candidatus Stahlbacteria) CG23_combo_of_CG06-09_8_20_14_all_34_7]|nr:MAG: hypothetical protein COX48_03155 [bacterium (Candidatus Stahlbacteria) CG23_combo_of_CG06-09_8_20_14_all_34_7]